MKLVHQTTEGTKKEVLNVYQRIPHQAISPFSNIDENHPSMPGNNLGVLPPASLENRQTLIAQFLLLNHITFQSSMPRYKSEKAANTLLALSHEHAYRSM
ncbi:hypothetical protein Lal_00048493 [Lupinus albus]|nr:hypothetical protein Lal_00048493 [Lupinus albus]